jgi:hypothetical protein
MDYRTRERAATAMNYRNAPARLLTQLLNRGRAIMTTTEQEALQGELQGTKPGPLNMAQVKSKRKRSTRQD